MPQISKNSATFRIRICRLLQTRDFESHALSLQPLKLNNRQIIATKKQLHMLINCQCHSAKVAPNTYRLNFASNNLEYKLKSFILTLHVTNRKA